MFPRPCPRHPKGRSHAHERGGLPGNSHPPEGVFWPTLALADRLAPERDRETRLPDPGPTEHQERVPVSCPPRRRQLPHLAPVDARLRLEVEVGEFAYHREVRDRRPHGSGRGCACCGDVARSVRCFGRRRGVRDREDLIIMTSWS